jgi:hypothetical protein
MSIQISARTYDAWIERLEELVETNPKSETVLFPGNVSIYSPATVLAGLQRRANENQVHTVKVGVTERGNDKFRITARGDVVELQGDEVDISNLIQNAERLTGIRAEYTIPSEREAK